MLELFAAMAVEGGRAIGEPSGGPLDNAPRRPLAPFSATAGGGGTTRKFHSHSMNLSVHPRLHFPRLTGAEALRAMAASPDIASVPKRLPRAEL